MVRFMVFEKDIVHATEAKILELAEKMKAGDLMQIYKDLGSGFCIHIEEAEEPKPCKEFDG